VYSLLLALIYLAFISLGLPDGLLGSAWPSMYPVLGVPVSYAGVVSMIIAGATIISSLNTTRVISKFGMGLVTAVSVRYDLGVTKRFRCHSLARSRFGCFLKKPRLRGYDKFNLLN